MGLYLVEDALKGDLVIGKALRLPRVCMGLTRPPHRVFRRAYLRGHVYHSLVRFQSGFWSQGPSHIGHSVITSHTKRSYVCELNDQDSIDSAYAGNPARFINHAPTKNANVEISSKPIRLPCVPHC